MTYLEDVWDELTPEQREARYCRRYGRMDLRNEPERIVVSMSSADERQVQKRYAEDVKKRSEELTEKNKECMRFGYDHYNEATDCCEGYREAAKDISEFREQYNRKSYLQLQEEKKRFLKRKR